MVLLQTLEVMFGGMAMTFSVLILFYLLMKVLMRAFHQ
ncbi:OadG-related small transporter subunit [Caldanaerobius fijiensis]|nr:OadG-related small transporter subunit [Caldanaerobius fijiensis]